MKSKSKICKIIKKNPNKNGQYLAEKFFHSFGKSDLVWILGRQIDQYIREQILEKEKIAFLTSFGDKFTHGPINIVLEEIEKSKSKSYANFLDICKARFALGNGDRVEWGLATIAQHQERINVLYKNVQGLNETIERHKKAIQLIKENNISCLNDLKL